MKIGQTVTIGLEDSDIEEIDKDEVRDTLKELADLKRKEADCLDKLAQAVPEMRDSEVVVVSEKVRGMDLSKCVYDMYGRINHPHNFRVALAAGERLFSQYKFNQAGTPIVSILELCTYFNVGKTKLYEILRRGKFGKEEEVEKKPLKCIKPELVKKEKEGPPAKILKKEEKKSSAPRKSTTSKKTSKTETIPTT